MNTRQEEHEHVPLGAQLRAPEDDVKHLRAILRPNTALLLQSGASMFSTVCEEDMLKFASKEANQHNLWSQCCLRQRNIWPLSCPGPQHM